MSSSQFKMVRSLSLLAILMFTSSAQATIDQAISTGNPALLPTLESDVVSAALQQINGYQTAQNKLLASVYSTDAVAYSSGQNSQVINITENETVFPLLVGNKGYVFAARGTIGGRFAAFGSNPIASFIGSTNLGYENSVKRLLAWLLAGTIDTTSFTTAKNIALVNSDTYWTSPNVVKWLGKLAPTWKTHVCNDPATIATCSQNQDLLIINTDHGNATAAQDAAVLAAIQAHLALKKPILYLHTGGWGSNNFSDILSNYLGFNLPYAGNWFSNDAANFASLAQMQQQAPDGFSKIKRMLTHFKNQDFNFDWTVCNDDRSCKNMPTLVTEFYDGAEAVKQQVGAWEGKNLDVFSKPGRRLGKLLVLLGDKFRSGIKYPMKTSTTDSTTFLKALYADHATYIRRSINPVQPDLGSFSAPIPTTLAVAPRAITLNTKLSSISSSSGYYAPPGRSITLTRKDSNPVKAFVHINMLRSGAAHVFATYDRPMFLWSNSIPLETGKTVKITTPYGGIIFLDADGTEVSQQVQVAATGVARQAVFTGANFTEFNTQLSSTSLNWAEIKFPAIEIHSRLDLMKESVSDPLIGGDLSRLLNLTQTYLYKDIYGLAGMVNADIKQPAKVLSFCTNHSWDCTNVAIHGMTNIQHINADRANCGYGCSGNPYDQYWAYTPLGWGESHEIGHNLQRGRLKIYDSASTEVSNNIFPTHKWWRFNKVSTETIKYGRDLGFRATFDALKQAASTANPVESARVAIWVNGGVFQRLIFYWQMAMSSQNVVALGDSGWDLFRLMYIQERLFSKAIANQTAWDAQRVGLGFGQYTALPTSITSNDFMLVSMSYITRRDQRPFFDLWGVTYSAEASAQVASYTFPAVKKNFWVVANDGQAFKDPLPTPVLMNANSVWPLP